MKKSVRLIDLSLFSGIVIAFACLSLLSVAAGLAAGAASILEMLILTLLGVLPSIAAFWYFWWRSPVLDEQGISQGKRHVPAITLCCETFYDTRYRENVMYFYDSSKPHDRNDRKCPNRITVQATKRNQRLWQEWQAAHNTQEGR